ncbi:MAG TPA: DUF429 domain-containing protein [Acidimicrobiales bacterium]
MVAGLDGCRGGWVMVTVSVDGACSSEVERVTDLVGVIGQLESGRLGAAGVDIPIGLPETGARRCAVEARRLIGARRSSVFPAPVRGVLGATTYAEAAGRSRALWGRGLSRQAFGILPKVGEVDALITPRRQRYPVEVRPEVSFTVMAGSPMAYPKKTPAGGAERLAALRRLPRCRAAHPSPARRGRVRRRPRRLCGGLERVAVVVRRLCAVGRRP